MALELVQLDETNRARFETLLAEVWRQNWPADLARRLMRWRYDERPPGGETWLASHDGRCVAMLDSFLRPYLLDGRRILVREGCDWFCLPKYRPMGLGIRLMRRLMSRGEPGLAIGGSETTTQTLPRLGWKPLPKVGRYVLPLKARGLVGALLRARWPERERHARVIPAFVAVRRPRCPPTPVGGAIAEWRPGAPALMPLPVRPGLVQLLETPELEWLTRIPPEVANTVSLMFFLDGAPVAFSLSQLAKSASGLDGCIVHLQIAGASQAVVDWVVGETARRLANHGAGLISCSASAADKAAALVRAGFVERAPLPSCWWPTPAAETPAVMDVGYLRADDAAPLAALRGRRLAPQPPSAAKEDPFSPA